MLDTKGHKKETTYQTKGSRRKAIIKAAINEVESKSKATDISK